MIGAVPAQSAVGTEASGPTQNLGGVAQVNEKIKTNDSEQLQARNVENLGNSSAVQAETENNRVNRFKVEAILQYRSTITRAEDWRAQVTQKSDDIRTTVAFQRSLTETAAPVRDSGADTTVSLDVTA